MRQLRLIPFVIILALCGCHGSTTSPITQSQNSNTKANANNEGSNMQIKLWSTVFQDNGLIPSKYTCDDANVSPPLEWSGLPATTKSIALIVDDPDAPAKTWVHWVAFDIPNSARSLPEAVKPSETIPGGGKQGKNDFGRLGYGGPCPPSGTHRYFFKIYALDTETNLPSGATKDELLRAMEGHIVKQGELIGKYSRTH